MTKKKQSSQPSEGIIKIAWVSGHPQFVKEWVAPIALEVGVPLRCECSGGVTEVSCPAREKDKVDTVFGTLLDRQYLLKHHGKVLQDIPMDN